MRNIVAVVVCYHPEPIKLLALSQALYEEQVPVVWINNGPSGSLNVIKTHAVTETLELGQNMGVAAALNRGFEWAIQNDFDAVATFDQDSCPDHQMVSQLRAAWTQAIQSSSNLGAIGPATVDQLSGQVMFTYAPYNWLRNRFLPKEYKAYVVDHLITSGCITPCHVWQDVGPMNEGLFIDWVDNEWCARARRKNYELLMVGGVKMNHSIGESSMPLLWRRFHLHQPLRHYYLMRNALLIARQSGLDMGWRMHNVFYAIRVILASLIFGGQKRSRLAHAWLGLVHGLRGRSGKFSN